MADRGYESFNIFAHLILKGMYFVIRMKKINSNGILSAYDLPDSEFDTHIRTTLTRRHTKGHDKQYNQNHDFGAGKTQNGYNRNTKQTAENTCTRVHGALVI